MNSIYPIKEKLDLSQDRDMERILSLYEIIKRYELLVEYLLENQADKTLLDGRGLREITDSAVNKIEKELILRTLEETKFNRLKACKILKISYKTILGKMIEHGITVQGEHKRKPEYAGV